MTSAEPDDETSAPPGGAQDATADKATAAAPRGRRRWPWLVILVALVLLLVATLGWMVGVGIVLRGRSLGAPLPSDAVARPTFVIATPSPVPSRPLVPATPPSLTNGDEYIVEEGDTLRSIAQEVYGDAEQWPRIYDANREAIGPDPDELNAGSRLRIPRP